MTSNVEPPGKAELESVLGSALPLWFAIIHMAEATCAPLSKVWKPSKSEFGRICLLQSKKRTLLYLTPDVDRVWIAIILGERAYQLAMASALPDAVKKLCLDAKPYAEGRGIRFPIGSLTEISTVAKLLEIKTAFT